MPHILVKRIDYDTVTESLQNNKHFCSSFHTDYHLGCAVNTTSEMYIPVASRSSCITVMAYAQ